MLPDKIMGVRREWWLRGSLRISSLVFVVFGGLILISSHGHVSWIQVGLLAVLVVASGPLGCAQKILELKFRGELHDPEFIVLYRSADHRSARSAKIKADDIDHAAAQAVKDCPEEEFVAAVLDTGTTVALLSEHVFHTKSGRALVDPDIEALADEAERGYDVEHLEEVPSSGRWAGRPTEEEDREQ